jgi:hypothetical protein
LLYRGALFKHAAIYSGTLETCPTVSVSLATARGQSEEKNGEELENWGDKDILVWATPKLAVQPQSIERNLQNFEFDRAHGDLDLGNFANFFTEQSGADGAGGEDFILIVIFFAIAH